MMTEFPNIKIFDMLPEISCPTLVLHSRDDAAVPVHEGRLIAARIRGARFVELPSRCHLVGPGDPAWDLFVEEFSKFLSWDNKQATRMRRSLAA
jgi:pimeloyl-ACP methyl ester carboxylesterase